MQTIFVQRIPRTPDYSKSAFFVVLIWSQYDVIIFFIVLNLFSLYVNKAPVYLILFTKEYIDLCSKVRSLSILCTPISSIASPQDTYEAFTKSVKKPSIYDSV